MSDTWRNYELETRPYYRLWSGYQQGLQSCLEEQHFNIYAVANFNRDIEPENARRKLAAFDQRIAHALLGRKWCRKPPEERIHFIALPELASWFHYNILMRVPENQIQAFLDHAPIAWAKVSPGGQFWPQRIRPGQQRQVVGYSLKAFSPRLSVDWMVLSSEFRKTPNLH